jgi:signal transduction histidine kinase
MGRLLDELLELSRIGRLMNLPEKVRLTELGKEAVEMLDGSIAAAGVEVKIDPWLPTVEGDRQRLLEVYQNLIDNAVKFMGDQEEPRVEIGQRPDGDGVVLWVRDNGIGIDPRYKERVFQLFERLEPDRFEGTGIGLALVKRIVEVHGGRIWIESDGPGRGTTLCFTLGSVG